MNKKTLILNDLKSHLKANYFGEIKDVILFGSQAQDKNHPYSDYDFLVVLKHDYSVRDENELLDLAFDINVKHDVVIDLHLISEKEIHSLKGRQPVYANALKKGVYA